MITAHLPAGYVLGRSLTSARYVVPAAVFGAALPDLDLIWFYLIDDRAFHHHHYWVHIPGFWLIVGAVVLPLVRRAKPALLPAGIAFFLSIFLHICLDAIAGGIAWAWPFSDRFFTLIEVPARFDHWVLNFILHPVFLIEVAIWAAALTLPVGRRREA
ncbi:metal-dependent hydrolase [Aestuariibius sp. 2305UL40-4]|uniref:metal-dependent hydrolase n=1 Tax=Aestuariibius violaceus TaxID=3234132 RepID=UPI00345E3711